MTRVRIVPTYGRLNGADYVWFRAERSDGRVLCRARAGPDPTQEDIRTVRRRLRNRAQKCIREGST